MITTSRRSSFVRVLIVSGIALGVLAPSASAVDPPPLGDPFDHFAGRKSIGQEGVITLGDGTTNTLLNLRRLTLRQEQPAGDPAPPKVTVNPPSSRMRTASTPRPLRTSRSGIRRAISTRS